MSTSRESPPRAAGSARSRAAEKVRLEARLADSKAWTSLQALRQHKPGKGLMDAIDIISQRERLERELMQTNDDYRAWVALPGQGKKSAGLPSGTANAPSDVFKTRVRVKAGTASASLPSPSSAAEVGPPNEDSSAGVASVRGSSRSPAGTGRGHSVIEEASVTIVRRAKDGTETRIELDASGEVQRSDPASVR